MRRNMTVKMPKFLGVWPKDHLYSIREHCPPDDYPICYIANTHNSNQPGEHWVAYYWDSPQECEFFDSYAQPPSAYDMPPDNPFFGVTSNSVVIQALDSDACGHHCVWYLILKANGHSMDYFIQSYLPEHSTLKQNDDKAKLRVRILKQRLACLYTLAALPCPADNAQCCKSRDAWCSC